MKPPTYLRAVLVIVSFASCNATLKDFTATSNQSMYKLYHNN